MCSHSISGGSCSLPFQSLTCPQAQAAAACSLCTAARMIWAQPFLLLRRPVLLSLLIHHSLLCNRLHFKWPTNANFCSVAVDWLFSRHVHYSNLSFVPFIAVMGKEIKSSSQKMCFQFTKYWTQWCGRHLEELYSVFHTLLSSVLP